jgi:hypothetical protein
MTAQRVGDARVEALHGSAQGRDRSDDDDGNAGSDDRILDGARAAFVAQEPAKQTACRGF